MGSIIGTSSPVNAEEVIETQQIASGELIIELLGITLSTDKHERPASVHLALSLSNQNHSSIFNYNPKHPFDNFTAVYAFNINSSKKKYGRVLLVTANVHNQKTSLDPYSKIGIGTIDIDKLINLNEKKDAQIKNGNNRIIRCYMDY